MMKSHFTAKRSLLGISFHLLMLVFFAAAVSAVFEGSYAERIISPEDRAFWSFQPVKRAMPPAVKNETWPRTAIDRFILAKLESQGFQPAPEADKPDLIRRLYVDVIGLPPTPEAIDSFLKDRSIDAYERCVEQLLNSPQYGERCAQHWLDLVRYAETEGFEYDRGIPDAWHYRDYVIDSFNRDKPYNQFISEQLAGDEIDPDNPELQVATGFHRLGAVRRNAGNQNVTSSRNEVLTERTDIIGAALLGLTIGCARCHDHKFDPIRQKDYYQLQAFLAATEERDIVLASAAERTAWEEQTEKLNREIKHLKEALKKAKDDEAKHLRDKLTELEESQLPPLSGIASIHNSATNRTAIHVLKRGDWESKGEPVGMRGPAVLLPDDAPERPLETKNPRSELARWITDPQHPLTARVIVNRIWMNHFSQGIVKTPNDFGVNGDRPSHSELLDYLASALVEHGWRMKPIHKMILLSSAYRQASASPHATMSEAKDPENRLLWRFNRRRLDAETLRDAMLAVSGKLNAKSGGPSVLLPVDQELVDQLYKPSQWMVTKDPAEHDRRSIYLLAKRNLRLPFMEVFDQPASLTSCPRRESSTHAPQALELLNGRISNHLAQALAERLQREAGPDPSKQIERGFRLVVGRSPTSEEREFAQRFLRAQPLKEFALALFNLNGFLYVK
jgi:hypothetical protein